MRLTQHYGRVFVAACLALVAACNDNNIAPQLAVEFDASSAAAKVAPITAVLDQTILHSFNRALTYYESFLRSTPTASVVVAPSPGVFGTLLTRSLAHAASIRADAIPANVKGKTFIYDPAANNYMPDPDATGAPASGVRFVLYAWVEGQERPPLPLTRIGYVDIQPVGNTGASEQTQVRVTRDASQLTVADFVVMHGTTGQIDAFGIEGVVTDGTITVDVALNGTHANGAQGHTLVFDVTLSGRALGVGAHEQLTFDQATASQGGSLELSYDGHTFSDVAALNGHDRDLEFDGRLYARVIVPTTSSDDLQYLKPDGTSLTPQEIAAVSALLESVVVANFFWIDLSWP